MASFRESLLKGSKKKNTFGDTLRSVQVPKPKFEAKPIDIPEPEPTVTSRLSDFISKGQERKDLLERRGELVDVTLGAKRTPEQIAAVEDFERRQRESERERRKPKTFAESLARPFTAISRAVESALDTDTGVTSAIEGATAGAVRELPLIGKELVPESDLAKARREQQFKTQIDLPFLGETTISPVEIGQVASQLGLTAYQYNQVGKMLDSVNTTSKLGKLLGGTKFGKFAAKQGADLLTDTIVQTPRELIDAIKEDKTLGEASKDFLKNRAIDVAFNLAIGGVEEGINALRGLRNSGDQAVVDILEESFKDLPDSVAKNNIRNATGIGGDIDAVKGVFTTPEQRALRAPLEQFTPPKTRKPITFGDSLRQQAEIQPTTIENVLRGTRGQEATLDATRQISPRTPDVATPVTDVKTQSPLLGRLKKEVFGEPELNALKREMKNIDIDLPTTSNLARTEAAQRIIDTNFENALKIAKEGEQFGSRVESEVARLALPKLAEQGRHKEYVEIVEAIAKKGRASGQDVQLLSLWSEITPEGASKWAVQTLQEADVKVDPKLIDNIRRDFETIQTASKEELAKNIVERINPKDSRIKNALFGNLEKQINTLGFAKMQDINRAIAMEKITKHIPVIKAKKVSSIQAISHLLNTRTFMRNIIGNIASVSGEMISRNPAAFADKLISLYTGNRTVAAGAPQLTKSLKEGWKAGRENFFEIIANPRNKQLTSKYEKLFESAFKSKVGKGLEKTLQVSLQSPDEFFKAFVKTESLFNQLQARLGKDIKKWNVEQVLNEAKNFEIENAIKEAEFATFQNDSLLADVLSETKTLANKASSLLPGKLFTEDFGFGDMTIKYTRVPGNIITRSFEYSPLGGAKALFDLGTIAAAGKELTPQLQRKLSLAIGRGLTGTGIMALGGFLRKNNVITPIDPDASFNKQAFDKAQGEGGYKINMSALGRLISGKDTTPQEGDALRSFNFLQPFNVPLAVGSRISDEGGFSGIKPDDLFKTTWEEAVDLPTMFIVKKMMYEGMDPENDIFDIMSVPIKEALPGFVPSVSRQIAQLLDPTIRETRFGANIPVLRDLPKEIGGKIQANLPLLSKKLEPKLDVFGEEQKRDSTLFGSRTLGTLFDPGFRTDFTPKPYNDKIQLVAELSGKENFFPDRKPPTTTTLNAEKFDLTSKEQQRWQEVEGQALDQLYTEFFNTLTDKEVEENAILIAEQLAKIKRQASDIAKQDFFENRGD